MAAILENIVFGHNSAADCPIVAKFCTTMKNLGIMTVECETFQTVTIIQDGGRPSS